MRRGGYPSKPWSEETSKFPKLPKGPAEGWPKPKPSDGGTAMTEIDLDAISKRTDLAAAWRRDWADERTLDGSVLDSARAAKELAVVDVPELIAEVRQLRDAVEPFGDCAPDCDCSDHQRVCLCHVTGAEAREWIRREQARADLLEAQRDRVLALHVEHEGRCTHCVEWCDCICPDACTHGNVEWPCPTAAIYASSAQPSNLEAR